MATAMSVECRFLLKLLADDQWHPIEEVAHRLESAVAPGKALRRYESKEATRRLTQGPRKSPELTDEEKIASGRRTLANVSIHSLRKRHVELKDEEGRRWIRRRPGSQPTEPVGALGHSFDPVVVTAEGVPAPGVAGLPAALCRSDPSAGYTCRRCGMWAMNRDKHEEFHRQYDQAGPAPPGPADEAPAEVAFFSGPQIRDLVRQEVSEALDGFQQGMQTWLLTRFVEIEKRLGRPMPPKYKSGDRQRGRR